MCYRKASFRPGHNFIAKDSENISRGPDNCPVYHLKVKIIKQAESKANLNEGDDTESKTKSKEAAKGGDELNRSHSYSALHLCYKRLTKNKSTKRSSVTTKQVVFKR